MVQVVKDTEREQTLQGMVTVWETDQPGRSKKVTYGGKERERTVDTHTHHTMREDNILYYRKMESYCKFLMFFIIKCIRVQIVHGLLPKIHLSLNI